MHLGGATLGLGFFFLFGGGGSFRRYDLGFRAFMVFFFFFWGGGGWGILFRAFWAVLGGFGFRGLGGVGV